MTLLLSAICFSLWPLQAESQIVSARAGKVCHVGGDAWYHPHNKSGVQHLEVGIELINDDLVWTGDNGHAEWSLNPDSYIRLAANSFVRIQETSLERMRFDIDRGEAFVNIRSLSNGASLVLNTPPGLLTVHKPGRYLIRVAANGETEAIVVEGELRYKDKEGKLNSVKKGKQVKFYKVEKSNGA